MMKTDTVYRVFKVIPKKVIDTFKLSDSKIKDMLIEGDNTFNLLSPKTVIPIAHVYEDASLGSKFILISMALLRRPASMVETHITYYVELLFREITLMDNKNALRIKVEGYNNTTFNMMFSTNEYGTTWGLQNLIE